MRSDLKSGIKTMGTAAIAAVVTGMAATAHAAHIDTFTEGAGNPLTLLPSDPEGSESQSYTDPDGSSIPLGGNTRFTQIEYTKPSPSNLIVASQVPGDSDVGLYEFSNSSTTRGRLTIRYGDNGTLDLVSNPGGANYQFLRTRIAAVDPGNFANFTITAEDTDGDSDSAQFGTSAAGDFFTPYAAFDSSVDFNSLDTLSYEVIGQNDGLDVSIDEIFRAAVPEPTSLALLGLGGTLLMVGRRRGS